jgi:hypothetical protein
MKGTEAGSARKNAPPAEQSRLRFIDPGRKVGRATRQQRIGWIAQAAMIGILGCNRNGETRQSELDGINVLHRIERRAGRRTRGMNLGWKIWAGKGWNCLSAWTTFLPYRIIAFS